MMKLNRLILESVEGRDWELAIAEATSVFEDRQEMLLSLYKSLTNVLSILKSYYLDKQKYLTDQKISIENKYTYLELIIEDTEFDWAGDVRLQVHKKRKSEAWIYIKKTMDTRIRLYPRPDGWMVLIQYEETKAEIEELVKERMVAAKVWSKIGEWKSENKDNYQVKRYSRGAFTTNQIWDDVMMWHTRKQDWNSLDKNKDIARLNKFDVLKENIYYYDYGKTDLPAGSQENVRTVNQYVPDIMHKVLSASTFTNHYNGLANQLIKNNGYKEVSDSDISMAEEVLNYKWVHHEAKKKDPNAPDFLSDFGY